MSEVFGQRLCRKCGQPCTADEWVHPECKESLPKPTPATGGEVVAYVTGQYGGYATFETIPPGRILPVGMAFYARPLPAADDEAVAWQEQLIKRICERLSIDVYRARGGRATIQWRDVPPGVRIAVTDFFANDRSIVLASTLEAMTKERDALRELLRSAHAIAARKGADTAWERFAASCAQLGAGPITARVYKVEGAAPEEIADDSL